MYHFNLATSLSLLLSRLLPGPGANLQLDTAILVSAAAVALLRGHALLSEHVTQLGYIPRLLSLLVSQGKASAAAAAGVAGSAACAVPAEAGGTVLRLLHQLCASGAAAEAVATVPVQAVPTLLEALVRWGAAAAVLVLETLKRVLTVHNRQRDLLISQVGGDAVVWVCAAWGCQLLQLCAW